MGTLVGRVLIRNRTNARVTEVERPTFLVLLTCVDAPCEASQHASHYPRRFGLAYWIRRFPLTNL